MNWTRDEGGLGEADLEKVFKYEPRETTVIRILARDGWQAKIYSVESDKEWRDWLHCELPFIDENDSGLVLLLAKRSGEPALQGIQKTTSDGWLEKAEKSPIQTIARSDTFAALGEKSSVAVPSSQPQSTSGRRGVRTVPCSRDIFKILTRRFHIHGSIARVISRTDVPIFTHEKVNMEHPAYVYNCRSSNAWEMDLALAATHFPKNNLTFSILFGCPFDIEKEIITRLSSVRSEAAHPLLMPGVFAELERLRHAKLVEEMGNKVESKIFELDYQSVNVEGLRPADADQRSREKRTAYLDLAYLRNALVSWNTQLEKMVRHSQQLTRGHPQPIIHTDPAEQRTGINRYDTLDRCHRGSSNPTGWDSTVEKIRTDLNDFYCTSEFQSGLLSEKLRHVSSKITSRLLSIMDEYDDKIRDCTMRVDGMAMSTQWAQGETNVEIALATNRDSRIMRSIALVTMIFLPGTFFASMFSMSFFNWSGSSFVSPYVYIYFVFTGVFTALTLWLWWYVAIYRPRRFAKLRSEV